MQSRIINEPYQDQKTGPKKFLGTKGYKIKMRKSVYVDIAAKHGPAPVWAWYNTVLWTPLQTPHSRGG